ncbi:hypothetical protein RKS58_13145 [Lysinibacillus capsici]|uniref:hypothetical protein n=1 Tax=Lysinibacillus capsici TaxID=2115968 RepID=UPI0028BD42A7|nr:hypothetical protein [Lysinibacillus capsici]WNN74343.1 hypothetical protein RKS58_13145 [Lysinibacillus capsici]
MLRTLQKTGWLHFNAIWAKPTKETSATYTKNSHVRHQTLKPYEAYSQIRRNMY